MTAGGFEASWKARFGQLAPLGFVLRGALADRWVRFHALPGSKRYAETDTEAQVILDRGYSLGGDMFAAEAPVWISLMGSRERLDLYALTERFDHVIEKDRDDEDWVGTFGAMAATWSSGAFDRLLDDVANDRLHAVFFDPGTGRVFAPYDGGFDLIWESKAQAEAAQDRYPDWLSPHPLGL